ncbi:trypsin-like serine protease [Streptomyces sp. BHT-5-2]|uniref:LamG-like jellyroll fold domain-containing protein n=1 Tax=Streptomyces sp. BHT-5-2 TaxID=2866715 RepID=UPI001C8DEA30|nr:LamG-like jellyroll fold domain-containing protein [Streptomyces sp. BHT-5-2]QZL02018.1 trypsin-like serine protease [Streptomyces sp. BHT-5-2]
MKLLRRVTVTGATAAACAAVVIATTTSHGSTARAPMMTVADDQPGYAIEDFTYPDGDKLKEEKGITLKRGDGHITLAECGSSTDLMEVQSRKGKTCFRITGGSGYLALEIPAVFAVKGSTDHAARLTLTTPDNEKREVEVPKNDKDEWTPVGESTDPQRREHLLVEISVGQGKPASMLSGDAARPWLARVTVNKPGYEGGRSCTGALVDRTWVLTAASCFADNPAKPMRAAAAPMLDATASFAGQAPVKIDYLIPRSDRDVLLARLATPVTGITPATLAGSAPTGASLVAAGFGRTDTTWVPNSPHHSNVAQSSTTDTTLKLTGGLVCKGDAGGPILDANGRIAAVQSRAVHGGCLGQAGQGDSAIAARTDNIIPWLDGSTFSGKARFVLDEDAGSRRVSGGVPEEFAARLGGGAELGVAGKIGTALKLNGTSAYAATAGPVVDTTKSFSVSAWVRLDDKDRNYTFLSQAGSNASGFQLYYSKYYDKWLFNRHAKDTDDTGIIRAMSKNAAESGVWTHLAGSYDAAKQTLSLFVNGELQQSVQFTTPWRANGGLQIGRLHYKGTWQENTRGRIDDVRVVQSAVEPADVAVIAGGSVPAHLQELASFPLDEESGSASVSGGKGAGPVATLAGGGAELGAEGKIGTALKLNGTSAYAATAGPVVDTTKSFSVSAWVRLDNKDRNYTFLSQAGDHASGFQLYYSKYYDKWLFNRHTTDTDDTPIVRSISKDAAQTGVWTQLTGVYDAAAKKIQLFVNGEPQTAVDFTSPWRAGSALQIGRLFYKGTWQENFAGTIDNIRIWDRSVEAGEIINDGLRIKN